MGYAVRVSRRQQILDTLKASDEVLPLLPNVAPVHTLYNAEGVVPPMCYTRTEVKNNPCYVCHQDGIDGRENVMNDADLQQAYSFSDVGLTNHWENLFEDRTERIRAISDEQLQRTRERMRAIVAQSLPGAKATISFTDSYPSMPPTPANQALLEQYSQISRAIGAGPVGAVDAGVRGAADISFVASLVESGLDGLGAYSTLISPLIAVAVSGAVALVVFVIVPSDSPTWRAAFLPAAVAGVGIGLLTSLYASLAPLLVGGFSGLGTIAYVFAALVWFNWVFQILMYAGAWARLRRDRSYVRGIVR